MNPQKKVDQNARIVAKYVHRSIKSQVRELARLIKRGGTKRDLIFLVEIETLARNEVKRLSDEQAKKADIHF
jgi:hypothetical protein